MKSAMKRDDEAIRPDKKRAAVCGLFCPSCIIYIAAREPVEKRRVIARTFGLEPEAIRCDGCRSGIRFSYCSTCKVAACATSRGIDFCGSCQDYPCDQLKEFQNAYPHRLELWQWLDRIAAVGYEAWYGEMVERFSCPACGTLNSAYHLACRACGEKPGNAFAADHRDEIVSSPRAKSLLPKKERTRPAKKRTKR